MHRNSMRIPKIKISDHMAHLAGCYLRFFLETNCNSLACYSLMLTVLVVCWSFWWIIFFSISLSRAVVRSFPLFCWWIFWSHKHGFNFSLVSLRFCGPLNTYFPIEFYVRNRELGINFRLDLSCDFTSISCSVSFASWIYDISHFSNRHWIFSLDK